jgi:hypothetical protein
MANDILLENNDLKIINGDFAVGNSDEQNIEQTLIAVKGDFKQSPMTGVAIVQKLNAPQTYAVKRAIEKEINLQLKADKAKEIKVSYNDTLKIQAKYD